MSKSVPDSPLLGVPSSTVAAPILLKSPEASVRVYPDEWKKSIKLGELATVLKSRDLALEYRIVRTMTETDLMMNRLYRYKPIDGLRRDRYKDIVPFSENRVLLSDGSYINASYMPNWNGKNPRAFIASQGPLQSTIGDQWDLIWSHGIEVVVTIGKLAEGATEKCAEYWPTKAKSPMVATGPKNREFNLRCVRETLIADDMIIHRKISISVAGDEERVIDHYHFVAWPDHRSVPPEALIAIVRIIQAQRRATVSARSVLVHCSAGVGRTGCVLLLSNCVECMEEQLASGKTIKDAQLSVMSILLELRKNRVFIVERTWQYDCVYAAVAEIVRLGILP